MSEQIGQAGIESYVRDLVNRARLQLPEPGRLGWMLAALSGAVWLSIVLTLSDRIDVAAARRMTVAADIARLKAMTSDNSWDQKAQEARALRVMLEGRLWKADTPGLAEASFEAWLRDVMKRRGIEVQQIQIARVPLTTQSNPNASAEMLSGLERMTAKIISDFRSRGTVDAAADIAEYEKSVTIDRLIIRTGANARMEMDVSTIIRRQ
jgi:chorismate mutase